jgi:FkbM family methyltransferase
MKIASYDGLSYYTNDAGFEWHINNGKSEPYGSCRYYEIFKEYLKNHPERNRTYIDVGVHIGTTILPYSRHFEKAYGYEPNKGNFELALKNVALNKISNIQIKNNAVLDRNTSGITILPQNGNSGCFYFKEDVNSDIKSVKLDDENYENVDFIKIDTEGSELLVLKGAYNLIKKYKPLLQIEMNGLSEKHFGIKSEEILNFLKELGYKHIDAEFYANY